MSKSERSRKTSIASIPPLSWPPPGLERLQGALWRVIAVSWIGSLVLVLPLLWALAVEQPFYSLGPFEEAWELGLAISLIGAALIVIAFGLLFAVLRQGAHAAELGYGVVTILEVACDSKHDTGFLIQGKRHFSSLDPDSLSTIALARIRGAVLVLAGALWLVVGFGLAVLLAARGFVTPSGIWLLTLGPSLVAAGAGMVLLVRQSSAVRTARSGWEAQEGTDRVRSESVAWSDRLDQSADSIVLGSGAKGEGARFQTGAGIVVALFVIGFVPTVTIAVTTAVGPILAEIAVPSFLSVQEMAGAAEALRRYRVPPDPSIPPAEAGTALQDLAFVGGGAAPETWEHGPATRYAQGWFPEPDYFPDPFSETVAAELVSRPLSEFSEGEQAALRQAAAHPAHAQFRRLAQAQLVDVVSGRWVLPFPDSMTYQDLPWPRFPAFRTAGLARVAKAAVEVSDGQPDAAEATLRDLISTGFLLVDQGPTLIDNLMGVVMINMGGDALEALYTRAGRPAEAEALELARAAATDAARKARAGLIPEGIRSLLQGVPDLVETEEALRGLRWEYFATFNMLAPCINLHKMVFGPDDTYDEWRERARDTLVRVRGERDLFDLAESGVLGTGGQELQGFFARFLSLTLGSGGAPGSCASLIASLQ
ncbi:MAG TPA: hypothetical protein VMS76_01315 [Planctomycetota bacterium]|nr:hypothetical protein [Planctomycetota bacterium]